ncbi:Cas1p-domain-containing protein [Aulographum hederae CBS 113979]|uniref:Cas1p-domain-containing protein n=1 Tax=Aulographum hederae CBS 113979 TaxID=1176131 RepID=A0A6G1H6V0_9PEZI|nr:Cas1p-domain-containing protein [Aulographum hederae CBS 113979]
MLGLKAASSADLFNQVGYVLFIAVIFLASYRHFLLDSEDPYKCRSLLTSGSWLDPPVTHSNTSLTSRAPFKKWQPEGCLLHSYKPKEIDQCIEKRNVIFAGDSTVRQVFWATARKLNASEAAGYEASAEKHADIGIQINGMWLQFIWDPYLNSTNTREWVRLYKWQQANKIPGPAGKNLTKAIEAEFWMDIEKGGNEIALILLGGGPWFARWFEIGDSLLEYQEAISVLSKNMKEFDVRDASADGIGDQVFFMPGQVPVYNELDPAKKATVLEGEIEVMNTYLARHGKNVLWSFAEMTKGEEAAINTTENAFHVVEAIADRRADVLLNLRCNARLDRTDGFPFDRTCCSPYPAVSWIQLVATFFGGLAVLSGIYMAHKNRNLDVKPQDVIFGALSIAALTLFYCYLADRTQIFSKIAKQYTNPDFFFLSFLALAAGLLTIRESKAPSPRRLPGAGAPVAPVTPPDQPFLSRDQTEEWKGWMQFAILVYHWTGASTVLPIYQVIRILVASYLFQTGYGHSVFFLSKGDYSFKRVFAIMVRLNLLSCALPYTMGTNYLFYYFAPLVSFWYMVIWLTMRVYSTYNTSTQFVVMKIAVACFITSYVMPTSGFYNVVFSVLKTVARIDWDVTEWTFRVGLDRYIVYVGMLCGLIRQRANTSTSPPSLTGSPSSIDSLAKPLSVIAALCTIPLTASLFSTRTTKPASNALHPILSPLPIIAFILLRNSHRRLRNSYSAAFAWLGRCSLETFTLQFHIWLAADTKGLLSLNLLPGNPVVGKWIDFVILTPLFFWASWRVAAATGQVTAWVCVTPKSSSSTTAMASASTTSTSTATVSAEDRPSDPEKDEGASATALLTPPSIFEEVDLSHRRQPRSTALLSSVCNILSACKNAAGKLWPRELKFRALIMLAGLWVLNWVWAFCLIFSRLRGVSVVRDVSADA